MELTSEDSSSCNNNNNSKSRHLHLQDGCGRPEARISGSGWSRLFALSLGLLAVSCSGVHGVPLGGRSETEQAYRKLQENTVKYLAQFGYLQGPSRETQNLSNQQDLTRAIKALQKAGNIPQTGVPDRRTEELMARPRCGNVDDFDPHSAAYRSPYSLTKGSEPHSRKKRYTLATSKWQRTNLTFRFETYTKHMPREQTRHLISEAFRVWSDHTPLSFKEVLHSKADINILFASKYHSDGYPFDGPGMVLGHAFFPGRGKGGDTHFDDDEQWASNSTSNGVDLFMVAAHEFGHSLGLAHSGDPSALMYPWYMGFEGKFRLPDDDYRGITSLYGSGSRRDDRLPDKKKVDLIPQSNDPDERDPSVDEEPEDPKVKDESDTPPDYCNSPIDTISIIRGETFFFIGKWSFRIKRNGEKEIVQIHQFWQGFPRELDHLDAVVELPQPDSRILFFSGPRYWVFNSNSIAQGTSSEGRPITDFNIPDDVKKIDAAFVWGYNQRTYLVSGDMYWKMDERNRFVEYDYPRDMGTWRGVPVPLDAAFQDSNHKTLFFQGLKYWEFYDLRMRVRPGSKLISQWFNCPAQENEELKLKDLAYATSGTNSPSGGAAGHTSGKNSKNAAPSSPRNISFVLLFVAGFVHYHTLASLKL